MRVLVAGGTGFLGRPFVERLAADDSAEVLVLSRSGGNTTGSAVHHVGAEWRDAHRNATILEFAPDVVVNLIGGSHPRSSVGNESDEIAHNLVPFFQLLDALQPRGLRRVVFSSSAGAIYRSGPDPVEKAGADSPYVATKRSIEHYLSSRTASSGLQAVSLRISNPIGDVDRAGFGIVPQLAKAVIRNEEVAFFGDHTVEKDYVDIADVSAALCSVVLGDWPETGHTVLDVGSGWSIAAKPMFALITAICDGLINGTEQRLSLPEAGFIPSGLDLRAIERFCGWRPDRDVVESIAEVCVRTLQRERSSSS